MLEKLLEGFSRHQKIRVLYDVACTLSKHLNVYESGGSMHQLKLESLDCLKIDVRFVVIEVA